MNKQAPEQVYREHWRDIIEPDGSVDMEQVKKELFDYSNLIASVSELYDEMSGGRASNPMILPSVIAGLHREAVEDAQGICRECGEDIG